MGCISSMTGLLFMLVLAYQCELEIALYFWWLLDYVIAHYSSVLTWSSFSTNQMYQKINLMYIQYSNSRLQL